MAIYYLNKSTRIGQSDNSRAHNRSLKYDRFSINIQSIKYLLILLISLNQALMKSAKAGDVGGVSATANPIANSSGSVTNQAIQVLQGPYINNTYGNGVSCQGPTLNITPFLTGLHSWKDPYEAYYDDLVFDTSTDDAGNLLNPGEVLYTVPIRTGQKANSNVSLGLSATISIPLDRRMHKGCLKAADTQTKLQQQILANKRLDFEMARLKHCGEQTKLGVTFHPQSPFAVICSDIQVENITTIKQHKHSISSKPFVIPSKLDSDPVEQESSPSSTQSSEVSHEISEPSLLQSLQSALLPSKVNQPTVSLGLPKSLQQQLLK